MADSDNPPSADHDGDFDGVTYGALAQAKYGQMTGVEYGQFEGGVLADLLNVCAVNNPDDLRLRCARRLADRWLTRKWVFHPDRWQLLRDAFDAWRGDRTAHEWRRPLTDGEEWAELVQAHILDATSSALSEGLRLKELVEHLRRHLRRSVEKELLGHTLDSNDPVGRLTEELEGRPSTGKPGRKIKVEGTASPPDPSDILAYSQWRMDALMAVQRLSEADRSLLDAYYWPGSDRGALARERDITEFALRKRVERIRRRVQEALKKPPD